MFSEVPVSTAVGAAGLALLLLYQSSLLSAAAKVDVVVRFRSLLSSWLVNLSGTSSSLSKLNVVEQVAPNVIRVLGLNPGRMTLQGTNTYIVGTGKQRILIDTGDGSAAYMDLLLTTLKKYDVDGLSDILLTHGHFDHVGGCWSLQKAFPNARIWKLLTYTDDETPCECSAHVSNTFCQDQFHMHDLRSLSQSGESLKTEGAAIRVLLTPGHTNDHVCFLLERDQAIFTGDCILGEGTCTFQNLSEYMASLESLKSHQPVRLYPGHGPVIDKAGETIDTYINHRMKREAEIVALLEKSPSLTSAEIVTQLYPALAFALTFPAKRNVELHLKKLITEKRVVKTPALLSAPRYNLQSQ
ncbi:Beta-lactamase-like protein 2 [Aphanomyces cochlioides]|nr:Beta-lactamase-like protein 2 [Aphanomyces cochlioides]